MYIMVTTQDKCNIYELAAIMACDRHRQAHSWTKYKTCTKAEYTSSGLMVTGTDRLLAPGKIRHNITCPALSGFPKYNINNTHTHTFSLTIVVSSNKLLRIFI